MSALDALPPDQRAVLALLLRRGKDYDELAELLAIPRESVRQRAQSGLAALAPELVLESERRAEVGDFLLGQQEASAATATSELLRGSAPARAWARAVRAALEPDAARELPEVPSPGDGDPDPGQEPPAAPATAAATGGAAGTPPRSSRLGGAIVLGVLLLALAGGGALLLGGSDDEPERTASAPEPTTTRQQASEVVGQVNLRGRGDAAAVAQLRRQGGQINFALAAQGLAPTTEKVFYAVWLYSSPSRARRIGFTDPVAQDGRLGAQGQLPAGAEGFRFLVISREREADADRPRQIVLRGRLRIS